MVNIKNKEMFTNSKPKIEVFNNKINAFTLIELLAIITILAIIAVITVPIILNIIEKSKRGAAISSAHGFKDAVYKYYASEFIGTELELDGEYMVANGSINRISRIKWFTLYCSICTGKLLD